MRSFQRLAILLLIDIVLVAVGFYLALWLRFDGTIPLNYLDSFRDLLGIALFLMLASFYIFGLYNRMWQYASTGELISIVGAVGMGTMLVFGYSFIIGPVSFFMLPRSVFVLSALLNVFLIGGSRLSWRFMRDHWFSPDRTKKKKKPVLIVGAGDAGAAVAREMKQHSNHKAVPVGFVDDDKGKQKLRMFGIPVLGDRRDIPLLVEDYGVEEIIIAMPSASGKVIREIVDICYATPAQLKILPGLYELIDGKASVSQIRDLRVEDLLDREPVNVDLDAIAGYLQGRAVLVTGAGGTIGSELCRQIVRFKPDRLILLDHDENSVYEIHRELCELGQEEMVLPVVVDVKDAAALESVYAAYRPRVVFHAAAYKHVPLMECNPGAALRNNILGTYYAARAADRCAVRAFILVSTDKAVNPSSIMGASKRVAEMVIQKIARNSKTRFASVRFGNVLDSRGSVVPLFKRQIARNGPVTVTHPEMIRYFMTIPEAVQLVIQAGALTRGGEVFILDMGKPMKVVELARRMIRLAGFRPDVDVKIVFTGIRPGEKLYEELLTEGEGIRATCHQRIYMARPDELQAGLLDRLVAVLERPDWIPTAEEAVSLIKTVIPGFRGEGGCEEGYAGAALARRGLDEIAAGRGDAS